MMAPGSETTDTQFICYRALLEKRGDKDDFDEEKTLYGITDEIWDAASEAMRESPESHKFIKLCTPAFASRTSLSMKTGLVLGSQRRALAKKSTLEGTKRKKVRRDPSPPYARAKRFPFSQQHIVVFFTSSPRGV